MEQLLKTRRSIRKYKNKKIDRVDIDKILKCGLFSPTSRNSKPWEIYLTEDKEKISKLSKSKPGGVSFIKEAPLVIAIVANPLKTPVWIEDLSIMATIMQLEAHKLGIGSCWVQIRGREYNETIMSEDYVKEVLDITKEYKVLCLLSFGYANEEKTAYTDNDILKERINWR